MTHDYDALLNKARSLRFWGLVCAVGLFISMSVIQGLLVRNANLQHQCAKEQP